MELEIKPSDLRYKYHRRKETRSAPKFTGLPDPTPFDRDDLYEVLPMLTAVMQAVGSDDARVLNRIEEVMVMEMPAFIRTREEVFNCLVAVIRDLFED